MTVREQVAALLRRRAEQLREGSKDRPGAMRSEMDRHTAAELDNLAQQIWPRLEVVDDAS